MTVGLTGASSAEASAKHIFTRRVAPPVPQPPVAEQSHGSDADSDSDASESDPDACEEEFDGDVDSDDGSCSDGNEEAAEPDEKAAKDTNAEPLATSSQTARRTAVCAGFDGPKLFACVAEGCGRPPRAQYVDRRTSAMVMICCLNCCYDARDVNGDKVHTSECDASLKMRRTSLAGGVPPRHKHDESAPDAAGPILYYALCGKQLAEQCLLPPARPDGRVLKCGTLAGRCTVLRRWQRSNGRSTRHMQTP